MKVAVVLIAAIASVHSGSIRIVRQAGWGSPTPGWSTPPPETTPGWSPPPTTPGWAPPPTTSGWGPSGVISTIDLNAALAAAGSGWAAENHAENVQVTGAGGWGPDAQLTIVASGVSDVEQNGAILQLTDQDSDSASSVNIVSVGQVALASEGEQVDALGVDITNAQSGWAGAAGEGASAADAESIIVVEPAPLGMAHP